MTYCSLPLTRTPACRLLNYVYRWRRTTLFGWRVTARPRRFSDSACRCSAALPGTKREVPSWSSARSPQAWPDICRLRRWAGPTLSLPRHSLHLSPGNANRSPRSQAAFATGSRGQGRDHRQHVLSVRAGERRAVIGSKPARSCSSSRNGAHFCRGNKLDSVFQTSERTNRSNTIRVPFLI